MEKGDIVLFIGAHPDDIEFGCGSTLSKCIDIGCDVYCLVMSPIDGDGILYSEFGLSCEIYGISSDKVMKLDYPVRRFNEYRQSILDYMVSVYISISPEYVFVPSSDDIHQDHMVVHEESIRAFKHCNMLGYELPWNNLRSVVNHYIRVEENDVGKKVNAISCYASQSGRCYSSSEFIYSLARVRGTQVNSDYAEAFEYIRGVI